MKEYVIKKAGKVIGDAIIKVAEGSVGKSSILFCHEVEIPAELKNAMSEDKKELD